MRPVTAAAQHHVRSTIKTAHRSEGRKSPPESRESPSRSSPARPRRDYNPFVQSNRLFTIGGPGTVIDAQTS